MLIDMHIHTYFRSMCSILDPADLVYRAEQLNLSGIVITEHDYVWSGNEIASLKNETKTDLLILSGQEVSAAEGHVLVYGCYESLAGSSVEEVVRTVRKCGGVALLSHPFRYGEYAGYTLRQLGAEFARFDGIEALNGNQNMEQNSFGLRVKDALKLTATGGSDAHSLDMAGKYVTEFRYKIRDEDELVKELKAGRCRPRIL